MSNEISNNKLPTGGNPMVVDLAALTTGQTAFTSHYFIANGSTGFTGQEILVSWDTFAGKVTDFIDTAKVAEEDVALRFVHCYDVSAKELYLRVQICTMVETTTPGTYDLVTDQCAWYQIKDGQITATDVKTLVDPDYLDNFYYCPQANNCPPDALQNLAAGTNFVHNLVLPWFIEVLQMFKDNDNPTDVSLGLFAYSYNSQQAGIFVHSLALLLKDSSGIMVDNVVYTPTFKMKACDYGTLCPNHCGVYILP